MNPADSLEFQVGSALSNWQFVEEAVGLVFCTAIGEHSIAGAAYSAVDGFKIRVDMTEAAVCRAIQGDRALDDWRILRNRVLKKAEQRNRLAHFSISTIQSKNGRPMVVLMPSPRKIKEVVEALNNKGVRYSARDVEKFADAFISLSEELRAFAKVVLTVKLQREALLQRVNDHWQKHRKIVAPSSSKPGAPE